jgi:serine/threonine-protein kinase
LINREDQTPSILPFKLESEILRRISHPQIPGFVEAFSTGDIHYIVQEFIEGLPLSCLLDTSRRFSEEEVKRIVSQLLSILGDLHCPPQRENAVVHRDLRLSNLLLKDDKLFLVDFGFARFLDLSQNFSCPDPLENKYSGSSGDGLPLKRLNDLPSRKNIPGAETYRLLRTEISPRSDLFGAGVVAVDLFTNWVEDETLYNRPWQEVLPLSQPFVCFLQRLLSQEDGFETAAEALEYLRSLL